MRDKRLGIVGCLICVGGEARRVIDGTDMTADWLRFCLGSVAEELFPVRRFVSDRPELLEMAAACGWPVLEIASGSWGASAILSRAVPLLAGCDRFAWLYGADSFPMAAAWKVLLETARDYPTQIITLACEGRRRTPVLIPADLYPELETLPAGGSLQSVLSLHAARLRAAEATGWYEESNIPILSRKPVDDPAAYLRERARCVFSPRLFTDGKCFGPGVAQLLGLVDRLGSLRAAAAEMGMSYTKAWNIVHRCERELRFPLLTTAAGGSGGGGAALTREAHQMILLQRDYAEKLQDYADRLLRQELERYFPTSGGQAGQ